MSDKSYVRQGRKNDKFFVGYDQDKSLATRRSLMMMGMASVLAATGTAYALAKPQMDSQGGQWNMGDIFRYSGLLLLHPYPALLTDSIDGTWKVALLLCQTKCGAQTRLENIKEGRNVVVKGSLIHNGENYAIAISDGVDWLATGDQTDLSSRLHVAIEKENNGNFLTTNLDLKGEILDSKCWAGAMKPGYGQTHKSCAALCIRMGIAPSFLVKDRKANIRAPLLLNQHGEPFGPELLPLVADPVRLQKAKMRRFFNMHVIQVAFDDIIRLKPRLRFG